MKGKRTLTPDEKKLWKEVTRGDRKLRKDEAPDETADIAFVAHSKPLIPNMILPEAKSRNAPAPPVTQGKYANIDANTAEKFRKGNMPLDATLDLHGMTRDRAFAALKRFVVSHYQRGARFLLVITGKGIGRNEEGGHLPGVLRQSFPQWLAGDDLAPMILAFDKAQQKHGGSGAFYILLKRKR